MKKTMLLVFAAVSALLLFARPPHRHAPPPAPHHHHHHGSAWGKGGRNFWPGFVGGVAAGLAARSVAQPTAVVVTPAPVAVAPAPVVVAPAPVVVAPAPVIVKQPVYQTQNVWVEGRYVDTVQPNGVTVRTWQPGHYEQRTVQVQ